MKWRPWKREHADLTELEEAARRTAELEARAAQVARRVRAQDPWAGRVLDAIHQHRTQHRHGDPYAG